MRLGSTVSEEMFTQKANKASGMHYGREEAKFGQREADMVSPSGSRGAAATASKTLAQSRHVIPTTQSPKTKFCVSDYQQKKPKTLNEKPLSTSSMSRKNQMFCKPSGISMASIVLQASKHITTQHST